MGSQVPISWGSRVETYLDELELIAETIDLVLDNTRVQTQRIASSEVEESTTQLADALKQLEEKVAEREELLRASDAPPNGITLKKKLLSSLHIDDARLALRCEKVAETIELAHTRAISLFVCQYHLADVTGDIVRILSGASSLKTYNPTRADDRGGQGGLFDEAA